MNIHVGNDQPSHLAIGHSKSDFYISLFIKVTFRQIFEAFHAYTISGISHEGAADLVTLLNTSIHD
jgi:hypothetical protein